MIKHKRGSRWALYGSLLLAGGIAFFFTNWIFHHKTDLKSIVKKGETYPVDKHIQKETEDIFRKDNALFSYVKKFGLKATVTRLHELGSSYGDCHQPAHKAGRFAYAIYGTEAFRAWGSECHSGSLHGAMEAYFREQGAAHIAEDVDMICDPGLNRFFRYQCVHGIGHGLMAWADYEIFDALTACDRLEGEKRSCWTGVFMENIVGGLAHGEHAEEAHAQRVSKYLSDDPHYPCSIVDDHYKWDCYFYQTSRMMQIFSGDFAKVASACSSAPARYHRVCFESMGRDVGGVHRDNPSDAIAACVHAQEGERRIYCLMGAVQDTFWDPSGQDKALHFCKLLSNNAEKNACYATIFSRAREVLTSKENLQTFCSKAEAPYRASCLN